MIDEHTLKTTSALDFLQLIATPIVLMLATKSAFIEFHESVWVKIGNQNSKGFFVELFQLVFWWR